MIGVFRIVSSIDVVDLPIGSTDVGRGDRQDDRSCLHEDASRTLVSETSQLFSLDELDLVVNDSLDNQRNCLLLGWSQFKYCYWLVYLLRRRVY